MSDEIHFEVTGLSDLTASIDRIKHALDSATKSATTEAGQRLQAYAVTAFNTPPAPFTRSGNLQRSIKSDPVVQEGVGRYSITVGPRAIYSRIQELGGTIYPKTARMLTWVGPDGRRVFAHSVTIHPHPYFKPSYEKIKGTMNGIFERAWEGALNDG